MLFITKTRNCMSLMTKCFTARIFVLVCKLSMGDVCVQPEMILSAVVVGIPLALSSQLLLL